MSIEDLLHGWSELERHAEDYAEADVYYRGEISEVFASPNVRAEIARQGEAYRFNFAKLPVNILADRVELRAVTAIPGADAEGNAVRDEATDALIGDIWDANNGDAEMPEVIVNTLKYGDAYLMCWPVLPDEDTDETEQSDDDLKVAGVEITYHSPLHTRVIYEVEHPRRKAYAIRRWSTGDKATLVWNVDLFYPDRIEEWRSRAGQPPKEASDWLPRVDGADPLPNPYKEVPFFHYRTGLPYGRPVHVDAYGPQNAINKQLISMVLTTDSHGWPQRAALLEKGAELDGGRGAPGWESDADALNEQYGAKSSEMQSGPGTLQEYANVRALHEWSAADPDVFLKPAEWLVKAMATVTETPFYRMWPTGDAPSGESLKTADAPLAKRADRMTVMLTAPVIETWRCVLRMAGIADPPPLQARWAPTEVASGESDWRVVGAKQEQGVPQSVALVEAGYDAEQVAGWLDDEAEAMDLVRRAELLNVTAEALMKIGQAKALGVVDDAQARAIVERVAGSLAQGGPE